MGKSQSTNDYKAAVWQQFHVPPINHENYCF